MATKAAVVTPKMADWIIAELRCKANIFESTGAVSILNGDVVKSDTAISISLRKSLQAVVQPLENIPERLKDYHPGRTVKFWISFILRCFHLSMERVELRMSKLIYEIVSSVAAKVQHCNLAPSHKRAMLSNQYPKIISLLQHWRTAKLSSGYPARSPS